ncbi:hypothetical protein [Spiroplasma endosymbiont of Zeiraphera isertana]|uniref:hypothetical protein n=1 Tax=Spiroplasma endosymbiont of Zeiraphera isertana TaxID=3066313 RepID=UPI00313E452A
MLGQSAYTISQFAKISKTSARFNRQKFILIFKKNSWWNKKNHQPGLKFDFI